MLLLNANSFAEEMYLLLLKVKDSGKLVTLYATRGGECVGRVVDVTQHTAVLECQELDGEDVQITHFYASIKDLIAVDVYQSTFRSSQLKRSTIRPSGDADPPPVKCP